jgi:putative lipoprotein
VKLSRPLLCLLVVVTLAACGGSTNSVNPSEVSGTVIYHEPVQLPPGAALHVSLADLSQNDAGRAIVGEVTLPAEGRQPPLPFTITFDPKVIDPAHTYAIQAEVSSGGTPLLTTSESHPVLTGGRPATVEVTLHPAEVRIASTPAPDPRREVLQEVVAIDAALPSMERREGQWGTDDTSVPYTAYFDGDSLRRLEARRSSGDQGTWQWSYSFANGLLIFATGEDMLPSDDPDGVGRNVTTTVWFAPDGRVLAAERLADGAPETPGESDLAGVRMRAQALRDVAYAAREGS